MRAFATFSLLLSTSISALAVSTIPLTKLRGPGTFVKGSPDAVRARAAFLKIRAAGWPIDVPATDYMYSIYTMSVGIGNPPTFYNLAVDTGSSITFCGAAKPYVQTSTSIPTGQPINVTYGSGNFSGMEYLDRVTLAPDLVITNQSIGDALSSYGFQGLDGIIGVGPVNLTRGSLPNNKNATIPTVMDNLVSEGIIEDKVLGVYFAPAKNDNDTDGVLTYGGVDPTLYEGDLTYVNVTKTRPSSLFWGMNITSSTYGNQTVIPASTAGIVDTGTTQVLLADEFFSVYVNAIPGAKWNPNVSLLEIPYSSISSMQPLNFTIADRVFTMDVASQLFPSDENTEIGGVSGKYYGVVGNLSIPGIRNKGLEFIIGQKFMERYYAVFDADCHRIGFAQTNNTFTTYKG